MFGESDIKLKIKSLQGIRAKFFTAFICSILLATVSIIVFQILVGNIYSHVTVLEEKYSFLYFIVFFNFYYDILCMYDKNADETVVSN